MFVQCKHNNDGYYSMKKIIFILVTCLFLVTSCDRTKDAAVFLSIKPVTPGSLSYINRYPVFKVRQRVYYILVSKKPIKNTKLRLQVLKLDKKYPFYKIEPAYGIDINRKQDRYYVTDYFVLHKAGDYVIRIFSYDDLEKPVAETEFSVEAL